MDGRLAIFRPKAFKASSAIILGYSNFSSLCLEVKGVVQYFVELPELQGFGVMSFQPTVMIELERLARHLVCCHRLQFNHHSLAGAAIFCSWSSRDADLDGLCG